MILEFEKVLENSIPIEPEDLYTSYLSDRKFLNCVTYSKCFFREYFGDDYDFLNCKEQVKNMIVRYITTINEGNADTNLFILEENPFIEIYEDFINCPFPFASK